MTVSSNSRTKATARSYRAALQRLIDKRATHPDHFGKEIFISAASVAKEARRSRNPLYAKHRDILDEIELARNKPALSEEGKTGRRTQLEKLAELRRKIHELESDKVKLSSENLLLLHRALVAEERLQAFERARPR
jgi:hypothetical protein